MVGIPNRTGRCTICKRRRLKCDLLRPVCSTCGRLGLRCEYLVLRPGQLFINRSVANPLVKAVDVLSNADKTKVPENLGPRQATLSRAQYIEMPKISSMQSLDLAPVYRMQLFTKFIEVYLPKTAQGPTRACQTPASWVYILPDITQTNSAYNTSLTALCIAQLGIWNNDPVMIKESSRFYGSALGELRKTVSCRKPLAPEATLASIVILSTYEVFCGPSGQNSGWVSHVQGGSHILQLLGPRVYETPVGRLLFARIRTINILEALRTRRVSVLASLEWQCCTNENHDLYCHLQDLMIQLPSIMEALDTHAVNTNKTAERAVLIQLLQLCSKLDGQLLSWVEQLKEQVYSQLYWTVPSVANNPADDPILGRIFPLAFHFPSLSMAQLLILYWSTLVLLYRTIQDIQKRLKSNANSSTEMQHSIGPHEKDGGELCSDGNRLSNKQIALLADNIAQSFEYCYHSNNGTLGPQSTVYSLWVAQSFYESQSDRERELAWCSGLRNTSAPDSRFDLDIMKFGGNG